MSSSNSMLYAGLGLLGGFLADKVFNNGELTEKVVSGGQSVSETIIEKVQGGTETIRERIVENNLINGITENVSEGLGTIKDKASSVFDGGFSSLNYSPLASNTKGGFFDGYKNFKNNGGIIGEVSDVAGFGWLADNIKNGTQTFFSGAHNIGTFVKGAVTGQQYETKMVNGQAIRYPVATSSVSGDGKKKKKKKTISNVSTSSKANFSSVDGTSKYVAPKKSNKKLNYTPAKKSTKKFFSSIGVRS